MQTIISGKSVLTAKVIHGESRSAKCRKISNIGIYADDTLIATNTCGGEYNEVQALNKFRKENSTFKRTEFYPIAQALKLAP